MNWTCGAAALVIVSAGLAWSSVQFDADRASSSMPITAFSAIFFFLSVIWITAMIGLQTTVADAHETRRRLQVIFLAGLIARALQLTAEPVLEVDFNRYLWDGGLTAHRYNPYAVAPGKVAALPYNDVRLELSKAAGSVFDRISYPELKTIYPPIAQAAFALAHLLDPWSLTAWRIVCLAGEIATFALLLGLLRDCGRSSLFVALYWWNPLVLKEVANSGHMEAILIPPLLLAMLLAIRARPWLSSLSLCAAVGVKVWPLLLLPLLLRPFLRKPIHLFGALSVVGLALAAMALPVWRGGIDATSGFVAFAQQWSTNSALFPVIRSIANLALGPLSPAILSPELAARGIVSATAVVIAIAAAWKLPTDPRDLIRRAYLIISAIVLLSPAQFPWYILWVLPLAVVAGGWGWIVASATMPLYYLSFQFLAQGTYATAAPWLTGLIWAPIWLMLGWDWWRDRQSAARLT